jgi:hypothetical protein
VGEVKTRQYTRGTGDNKETVYDADVYAVERHIDFTADDLTIPGTDCSIVQAGTNADGRCDRVPGEVAILFALGTPEPVLVVGAGELLTRPLHRARRAQEAGLSLASGASLGPLGLGREEQVRAALAHGVLTPRAAVRQIDQHLVVPVIELHLDCSHRPLVPRLADLTLIDRES